MKKNWILLQQFTKDSISIARPLYDLVKKKQK